MFVWLLIFYHSGEKIYIKSKKKPNKIKGFRHLTNAYITLKKGEIKYATERIS